MREPYQIYSVELRNKNQVEQMGTKEKFWIVDVQTDVHWLFKYNRPDTGEDWSEKIASEVAELLGLPHAFVELAVCEGERGVVSKDFTVKKTKGSLVHGNEILTEMVSDYPTRQYRGVSQHSLPNIIAFLSGDLVRLPADRPSVSGINTAVDMFLGYLMLDALIGNTDRHHQNWGVLVRHVESPDEWRVELAPSFDHASSLGRELGDSRRESLLSGANYKSTVEDYAQRARSAIYSDTGDTKPLSTLDAFMHFWQHAPEAGNVWLDKLRGIGEDSLNACVNRVPKRRLSTKSAEFVCQLLSVNRKRLVSL